VLRSSPGRGRRKNSARHPPRRRLPGRPLRAARRRPQASARRKNAHGKNHLWFRRCGFGTVLGTRKSRHRVLILDTAPHSEARRSPPLAVPIHPGAMPAVRGFTLCARQPASGARQEANLCGSQRRGPAGASPIRRKTPSPRSSRLGGTGPPGRCVAYNRCLIAIQTAREFEADSKAGGDRALRDK
jgi:hypothetical protein